MKTGVFGRSDLAGPFEPRILKLIEKEELRELDAEINALPHVSREIIRQVAMGTKKVRMSPAVMRNRDTIYRHLKKPAVQAGIAKMEGKQDENVLETKQRIRNMVHQALDTVEAKMKCGDDNIELRAAITTLDRDPSTKVAKDVFQPTLLTPEGVKTLTDVMKEIKEGESHGRITEHNKPDTAGLSAPGGNA